ncbi:MAG: hypothetical protein HY036_01415 [Nitrospirae bacterium]|nr:hypothetical protein [Nitrospirota bacterium]MBI3351216.1 hypothetical protein [Nitrospirota bacterium]
MRQVITWKGTLITLSVLILSLGVYKYAVGDITFPNTFSNGTVADATQVNANFAAINTRSSATSALMTGTWNYLESGSIGSTVSVCSITGGGTIILNANNSVSITENGLLFCPGTAPSAFNNGTVTGTYSVSTNGSGTINITGGAIYLLQASKDLNQMIIVTSQPGAPGFGLIEIASGTALRQ